MSEQTPHTREASHATTTFPIKESGEELYSLGARPDLEENVITHWTCLPSTGTESYDRFGLVHQIGTNKYVFTLNERTTEERSFIFSFETEKYGFATTDLNSKETDELLSTCVSFVESLADTIHEIEVDPASTSYSVADIEDCIGKILSHPKNTRTREELAALPAAYKDVDLFEIYEETFGEPYHETHPNLRSRSKARSRAFRIACKKYFTSWNLVEYPEQSAFRLVRKT